MAKLWLVACGLRLGYFRWPQVTCCLKLGPSCASTSKTCGQRFGVPQASAKLFTPGKSVRDRGTNSLTPGPLSAKAERDNPVQWTRAQGRCTLLGFNNNAFDPKGLLLFPILIVNIRPVIIVIPNTI